MEPSSQVVRKERAARADDESTPTQPAALAEPAIQTSTAHASSATSTMSTRDWAWWAFAAAQGEIRLAWDSVVDDLEGIATAMGSERYTSSQQHAVTATELDDSESTRIDDLHTPLPQRVEYEQVPDQPARHEGFELIDFETEANIITFT